MAFLSIFSNQREGSPLNPNLAQHPTIAPLTVHHATTIGATPHLRRTAYHPTQTVCLTPSSSSRSNRSTAVRLPHRRWCCLRRALTVAPPPSGAPFSVPSPTAAEYRQPLFGKL
ncbi:hypothetical protein U1Q18_026257 [Sarracenia purpurea var. burkii]